MEFLNDLDNYLRDTKTLPMKQIKQSETRVTRKPSKKILSPVPTIIDEPSRSYRSKQPT